nr:PEPxxWA-CTERM sorting domain-containing protein [Phenylobacterium kunshanense]
MRALASAICAVALLGGASAAQAASVLTFDDLAQAGTGRKNIAQNNFKYQGFNFYSTYSGNPNFFTLGLDDATNADPSGTTFGHTWDRYEMNITKEDGSLFEIFSIDIADIMNIGANYDFTLRFVYADNKQQTLYLNTNSTAGLETFTVNQKNLKAFLIGTREVGQNVQIDNIRLTGSVAAVPEPATWAMMLLGFFGLGSTIRARRSVLARA